MALQTKIRDLTKITGAPESLETTMKQLGASSVNAPGGAPPGAPPGKVPIIPSAPAPIISSSMKCKFLSSAQCHPDYPNF